LLNDVITNGRVAVVTGGASGIGLAAATAFAARGMSVAIVDRDEERLEAAAATLRDGAPQGVDTTAGFACDVSDEAAVRRLEAAVRERFGKVHLLMNNAGIQPGSSMFDEPDNWQAVIGVNLWGVINGSRAFAPGMIAHGEPALIINTGSKQGITTPPGDPAYNVSKAGVKAFTEALEHDLRSRENCRVRARLLIPGFVFTGLTARGRTEKPAGAWTPEQTVEFMMERLAAGDFYILCPDNEVDRATDEKRIQWAADDIVKNRPPLSRWHPDHADAFKEWARQP
jgi:NAD(P)-dependent dehydrogenase (short-subunit alcohol dehydrogenase family)